MRRRYISNKKANRDEKQRSARKPASDLYFRRRNLQESAQREHSRFVNCSSEVVPFRSHQHESPERSLYTRNPAGTSQDVQLYTRRSSLDDQKQIVKYSERTAAKYQATGSLPESKISPASDFFQEYPHLTPDMFFKIIVMLLRDLAMNGFSDMSEFTKFLNLCQKVFRNVLPPEILEGLKKRTSDETDMNVLKSIAPQPEIPQVSGLERKKKEADISLLSEILNQAKREPIVSDPSTVTSDQLACPTIPSHQHAFSTIPSHQYASSVPLRQNLQSLRSLSYRQVNFPHTSIYTPSSNESFACNATSSNMTPAIPTLTLQEQKESYSAYVYQSQYSLPSLPDYNNFKY